jgi:hypothetical protein
VYVLENQWTVSLPFLWDTLVYATMKMAVFRVVAPCRLV